MSQGNGVKTDHARRLLVERVSASSYFNRSARLRDLLHYLTGRVLEEEGCEIREHEVGHKVFGRPIDYDSTADNIVRVHASMLRKRLEQFFSTEGADEPWIIEIPKGNYAPVFHERSKAPPELVAPVSLTAIEPALPEVPVQEPVEKESSPKWPIWTLAGLAAIFAISTLWLLASGRSARTAHPSRPLVQAFWSQIFPANRPADIVFDDSAVALYQELTGKTVALSEYFDRSYLRELGDARSGTSLEAEAASTLVLRRQSNFSSASFYWKLTQMPEAANWHSVLRFARDYSFRDLKADSSILLGNSRTNPWVQPFEAKFGIRWQYDKTGNIYFPVDTWNSMKAYRPGGYCSIALVPNLGGTGNVLIVSGTGGSAMNSAAEFLADETAISKLRAKLGATGPCFEALIHLNGRSTLPRDASIVVARALRP